MSEIIKSIPTSLKEFSKFSTKKTPTPSASNKTISKVETFDANSQTSSENMPKFEPEKINDENILYIDETYTDENGDFHRITYDKNGNKIETHYYKDGSYTEDYRNENDKSVGERVIDRYDSNGKLTNRRTISDLGNENYIQYDSNGNVISSEVIKQASAKNMKTESQSSKGKNKSEGIGVIENAADIMTRIANGEVTYAEYQLQAAGIDTAKIKDGYRATKKVDTEIGTVVLSEKENAKPIVYLFDKKGNQKGYIKLKTSASDIEDINYKDKTVILKLKDGQTMKISKTRFDDQYNYDRYKTAQKNGASLSELDKEFGTVMAKSGDYNWEAQYQYSKSIENDIESPSTQIDIDKFNENIKTNVEAAGYGTRAGVVAAAKSIIVDYENTTGHRLRYDMTKRQRPDVEGIQTDDFYSDCSSFAWAALYNGGFNLPTDTHATPWQLQWAENTKAVAPIEGGKAGDFLIYDQGGGEDGHIQLIAGTYDNGYYLLEFNGSEGGTVSKVNYEDVPAVYCRIDMDDYYNNPENVRK